MIFAGILAGGKGTRMKMSIKEPKQFLMLGNKPVIVHTIIKFLECQEIDKIFVGVNIEWIEYAKRITEKYIEKKYLNKIEIVEGGKDRNETIINIINKIEEKYGENEENIILTHDAVRPFVTKGIIEKNIEMGKKYDACDTVISATDTIVASKNGEYISEIPDRRNMYQGQTPQTFKMSIIKKLYLDLDVDEKEILTDACKICLFRNVPVKLIEGEKSNIKITTCEDYEIAKKMEENL